MGVVVLPKSLTAKTEAKASDVMADLNAIVTQINGKLDLENLAESLRTALIPTGTLLGTARSSAPTGFLLCQGQAVSRTTYAVLFAAIGTTYGAGDGVTTFNLPDYRGRALVGADAGALRLDGVSAPRNLGQVGGNMWPQQHAHGAGGLSTGLENALHSHTVPHVFASARHEGSGFAYQNVEPVGNTNTSTESAFHAHAVVGTSANEGIGNGQNMPPYQVANVMVKT